MVPAGLTVTVREFGRNTDGTGILLLHGGAGPASVLGLAAALSEDAYVVVPTHPGFDGTPRPDSTDSVADLASAYLDLLDLLDLREVTVIGNSVVSIRVRAVCARWARARASGPAPSSANTWRSTCRTL